MKIKVSELQGAALDWAVAKCADLEVLIGWSKEKKAPLLDSGTHLRPFTPSTDWSQGGPIIEREGISVIRAHDDYGRDAKGFCNNIRIPVWFASKGQESTHESYEGESMDPTFMISEDGGTYGPTPLIAAMRCYVASKLGDEVEVPEELL